MGNRRKKENRKFYISSDTKRVIMIAWPSVLESFFVAFIGMIDSLMVSTVGSHAVAAVGLTTQPKFVALSIFIAMNVAVSALVARRKGEKRQHAANEVFYMALLIAAAAIVVISVVCVFFADPIIRLCGSDADTHQEAVVYFQIIMGGIVFQVLSWIINAAQRGSGNTKIAMKTNICSNLVNVLFNYLLIGGHFGFPALEVKGAAIATVLGTMVGCVMSIHSLFQKESFVGLSFAFGDGMQVAAVSLIGQSLGERKPDHAVLYGKLCRRIGLCISVILAALYLLGGRFLFGLFFEEPHIVELGVALMRFLIITVIFQISQVIYNGCLRAAGDVVYTTVASAISVTFVRSIGSYVGAYVLGWGLSGIWLGILFDQVSRFTLSSLRFRSGAWTKIKI